MQMDALAAAGYRSQTLAEFIEWHAGQGDEGEDRRVLITFDDAFADFAEAAVPTFAATWIFRPGFRAYPKAWPSGIIGMVPISPRGP